MNELNQALENVAFLKEMLRKGSFKYDEVTKVAESMRFLEAIEKGVNAKVLEGKHE